MRHLNSVFHTLLKLVPWHRFDRLVEKYEADAGTRKLTTKSQLAAMLYGQFAGIVSLRGIEAALLSHQARLYHIGVQPIRRSTLADANATRPYEVFAELFAEMVKQTHRGLR